MTAPIVIAPVAFGLGPASNAASVGRALRRYAPHGPPIVAVADGMAFDYLQDIAVFDAVVHAPAGRLPSGLRPSVTVSILDFRRAVAARNGGSRILIVDELFWMWDKLPLDPGATDGYLCLEFPGVISRIERLSATSQARATVIPQVLGAVGPRTAAPRRGVLLHLGGGFIPLPASWSYVRTLTALVSRLTRQVRPGEALTVTGSAPVVAALGDLAPEPGRRIVQLSPEQMSTAVASTTVLLTLPGRSTTLEGLVSGTPTVLLPGLNYSQHRHVGVFQHWIESMPVFSWADLPGYGLLPPGLAEGAAGWQAMDLGARFHRDVRAQGLLAKWLTAHLAAPPPAPRLGKGAPWTTFDGADHVARHALALTG